MPDGWPALTRVLKKHQFARFAHCGARTPAVGRTVADSADAVPCTTFSRSMPPTANHPFWNATDREWQQARELDRGDRVLTASGRAIVVGGLRTVLRGWRRRTT